MKEAAGEANTTVITIVLISIILGVGTIIVKNMMSSSEKSSDCSSVGNVWYNGKCYPPSSCSTDVNGKLSCTGNAVNQNTGGRGPGGGGTVRPNR